MVYSADRERAAKLYLKQIQSKLDVSSNPKNEYLIKND